MKDLQKIKERLEKRYDNFVEIVDMIYEIVDEINNKWNMDAFNSDFYKFEAKTDRFSNLDTVYGLKIREGRLEILADFRFEPYKEIDKDDIIYLDARSFINAFESLMNELANRKDWEEEKNIIKEILEAVKNEEKE